LPFRSYTLEDIDSDEPSRDGRKRRYPIFMLEDEINPWLKHGPKAGDDIGLITGGPGSGTSIFAKWLAAELSEKHRMRLLFIPLQRIRILASFKEAITSYLTQTKCFQQSPVDQQGFASPGDPLLLIFDGLDELTTPLRPRQSKRRDGAGVPR
jgi:predicted NACHT family NTPase